jgi:hypothetical protein
MDFTPKESQMNQTVDNFLYLAPIRISGIVNPAVRGGVDFVLGAFNFFVRAFGLGVVACALAFGIHLGWRLALRFG